MRILHINDYPPEAGGGAEVLLARTVRLLRERGVTVGLFTAADLADRRLTARRYLDNPLARAALADHLREFRPDVVHLHNFYHALSPGILTEIARFRRSQPVRVVMTAHDYHLVCPNSGGNCYCGESLVPIEPARVHSLGYLLTRRWDHRGRLHALLKLAQHLWHYRWRRSQGVIDVVLCPSRFLLELVRPLVSDARLLPHPAPPPRPRVVRPGPLRLVYAGRVEPEKGVLAFLQALPADFDAQLTVVGDGGDLDACRALGRLVTFVGRLPHAQTLAEIARAHVLVLPSRCLESYGLTLIEALAAGTNVLASDRGAMRELIADAGTGYLFDPDAPASLAMALGRIAAAHADGTLNRFDVSAFLAARSEAEYVRALLAVYRGAEEIALARAS